MTFSVMWHCSLCPKSDAVDVLQLQKWIPDPLLIPVDFLCYLAVCFNRRICVLCVANSEVSGLSLIDTAEKGVDSFIVYRPLIIFAQTPVVIESPSPLHTSTSAAALIFRVDLVVIVTRRRIFFGHQQRPISA